MRSGRSWRLAALLVVGAVVGLACGGDDDAGDAATASATAAARTTAAPTETATATTTATAAQTEVATPAAAATAAATAIATPSPEPVFAISSTAFGEGEPIPVRYSCDGENISPPLTISGVPSEAATLALLIEDPDAPGGTFDHWVRFNIAIASEMLEAAASSVDVGTLGMAGTNSFGNVAYGGPCPPSGTHRYIFTIYAIDGVLDLAQGATKAELRAAIEGRIVAQTELTGTYNRAQAKLPPVGDFPETGVAVNLTVSYKVGANGQPAAFDQSEFPVRPGAVQAQ